ncbi:hypothetical protein IMG5_182080 [Ichthyophthirius multifiliis]|uniref:Cytochrome b5 heme-binding domain-containing protein n=1 Tax=Ichthyophthirius multifiliis TaxID=5932 RepID=G0R301_ICHMU|nr:hypothetical protein IMG5_182080 [Ichthyophthirius multifiliis]EGR28161.1 hypothetical protein IMG5_182080 [Ichthyophthirius multifiliis]|eukprot:XP_004027506.1 hypothetical protein IMG5_182080 [Ichthyophthirius multifiliis]
MDQNLRQIEWSEVAEHNKEDDLWFVIENKVYNPTEYQNDHPGGPNVLINLGGKDATLKFDEVGHSQNAIKMLEKYLVGQIKKGSIPLENQIAKNSGSGNTFLYLILLGIIIAGIIYSMF